MTTTSTSKCLSSPTTTVCASNTPSAKVWLWKQHLILLIGPLLKQVSGDWSGNVSDDLHSWHCSENLTAEICSWHISIHRDAFKGFLWCSLWPVPLIWGRIVGYTHQMMIFHYKGQVWSRQSTGSGGHHQLSTVGLPGQSWWSLYQWCQQWSHDRLRCTMQVDLMEK